MLERVIGGGQTGADRAGWRAARAAGLGTGGWMPRGFTAEDGPHPEFAALYGAIEHESAEPEDRTVANVRDADGTLIFAGDRPGPGTERTIRACREAGVSHVVIHTRQLSEVGISGRVAGWIAGRRLRTLNVAGDRESVTPGIGAGVEAFLTDVFRELAGRGAGERP